MEFYATERKKELLPFATAWMELESIMLSEVSQAVKDKFHMISPSTDFQCVDILCQNVASDILCIFFAGRKTWLEFHLCTL